MSAIGSIGASGYSNLLARTQDLAARRSAPSGAEAIGQIAKPDALSSTESAGGSSFSKVLEKAVQEVDGKMKAADADQKKLLSGETDNLHQAMISIQESSVAFSLMVEVRNKLVESYQELMRMQV